MIKRNNKYLLNFAGRANASSVKNTQLLYKDYNNTNKIDFDQDVRGSENEIDPKHP